MLSENEKNLIRIIKFLLKMQGGSISLTAMDLVEDQAVTDEDLMITHYQDPWRMVVKLREQCPYERDVQVTQEGNDPFMPTVTIATLRCKYKEHDGPIHYGVYEGREIQFHE